VAISANDDVIMDGNAQWRARIDNFAGHVDISTRRRGVTGWVVMQENDRRCRQFQRAFDNFAGVDGRMINRASLLNLVGNQHIFLVEKEDAELLASFIGHGRAAIFHHGRPGRQDGSIDQLSLQHALIERCKNFQVSGDRRTDSRDLAQQIGWGSQNLCQRAKFLQQGLGHGFGVFLRYGAEKNQFQQFIICQCLLSGGLEAQP